MRFLDTMSLHIMCSGFTHAQRMQYQALEKGSASKEDASAEDDLDGQYLAMLLASEKEKDFKAYARMRQTRVGWFERSIREAIHFIGFRIFGGNSKVVWIIWSLYINSIVTQKKN